MATFHEFLLARIDQGGFSTEDALAGFLPLARQVLQVHALGQVAPLEGVQDLQVEGVQIWFAQAGAKAIVRNPARIRAIDEPPAGVEVLAQTRRTLDVDAGQADQSDLSVAGPGEEIVKPVYLPGYVAWEHVVGQHDPLTDVFSLGMILASLVCGLDFHQPEELKRFVAHRRNLFRIARQLHPVLAKAILSMTELSRRRRPQDLATLVAHLENYRDQTVDFELELASAQAGSGDEAAADSPGTARKHVILSKLQERLFELSRRNRLLHFRATLGSVNLTQASVPLAFDVKSIRPEQILTWKGAFAAGIAKGEAVSLNRYLNFTEQLYLPGVLDRIRSEAARDAAEFGFQQLRLAICFLRWANVKADPPEHYDSPLVLLPVNLIKKKGVRDSYWLQPAADEAEVNPVVRHLFKQLFGLDLPATLDLEKTTLEQFHQELSAQITASEPGVLLHCVDRPRIELIHEQARRRLDRYQRSARVAGRGVRSCHAIDYSYDQGNYHPLGLALFRAHIRPGPSHLSVIAQDQPSPRHFAVAPATGENDAVAEKDRQFYALRQEADDNPYHWDFDLCRLTLGNFKYRRMSLVRDYAELRQGEIANPAFEGIFSLSPRPVEAQAPIAPPLEERCHIVPCDPTQAAAIGLARSGASYIIQGPPGTGKSQTITNLIADYVMQGKRVLFVCEKRAAIDVVFARLRQQGLDKLCCLIHDSQTDKKEVIRDLKETYESLLAQAATKPGSAEKLRLSLVQGLTRELEPLRELSVAMTSTPPSVGTTVRALLERAIELAGSLPSLPPAQQQLLPDYAQWAGQREGIERLERALQDLGTAGVLAHHPLRLLSSKVVKQDRPAQWLWGQLSKAGALLAKLLGELRASGAAEGSWKTLGDVLALAEYAGHVEALARRQLLPLLDGKSSLAKQFTKACKQQARLRGELEKARQGTRHWTQKLPVEEVAPALEQARMLEGTLLAFLRPAWWRLGKVLRGRYRFGAHAVKPRWSQVLTALQDEYQAVDRLAQADQAAREELGLAESLEASSDLVQQAQKGIGQLPAHLQALHEQLLTSEQAPAVVAGLLAGGGVARELEGICREFLEDFGQQGLTELQADLAAMEQALDGLPDFLYCLGELAQLSPPLAAAFRHLPCAVPNLEAAIANHCAQELFRSERVLNRLTGGQRQVHLERLQELMGQWRQANAAAVLEKVRQQFLEHVRLASLPAAELTAQQKEFKAAYNRGRRELEHEFGKVMRYKSIRDLGMGDPGLVLCDLKPIWLMSPLSVSDALPLQGQGFDVVIFDEASQIPLEEAVPAIFRAGQAIVVGDQMQLPPTDFFSAKNDGEDEDGTLVTDEGQVFEYDLSSDSFLNHAAKNLTSRMLGWHYRSRSESLISFSNWAFYQGKLLTVPEEQLAVAARQAIVVQAPDQGLAHVALLLDRPLSFHHLPGGIYDSRRNRSEAQYIAQLVRGLLASGQGQSLGIVAFSEAQQSEIESALTRLAQEDDQFAQRLEAEYEREVDGQYVGLLVKNLENIQGDERDVVILSVCYGYAPDGKMRMNFGPINQSGGEKRLNVAFSRAKLHMAVVSSIRHGDITNDDNDGANCLKSYLQYAAACSAGDAAAAQRVLRAMAVWRELEQTAQVPDQPVVAAIAAALEERGFLVDKGVGMSHFQCDLAVRKAGEERYRLGILVDTAAYYQQDDLLERDLMRPQLLRAFGWEIATVLTRDWYRDRPAALEELLQQLDK